MNFLGIVDGVLVGALLFSLGGLIYLAILGGDPGPRRTAWSRGWLLAARGVLRGLWRSLTPFASGQPPFGRLRDAQPSCGSLQARRTQLLTEAARLQELNRYEIQKLQRLLDMLDRRV